VGMRAPSIDAASHLARVATLQGEFFADDLDPPVEAHSWSIHRLRLWFACGGCERAPDVDLSEWLHSDGISTHSVARIVSALREHGIDTCEAASPYARLRAAEFASTTTLMLPEGLVLWHGPTPLMHVPHADVSPITASGFVMLEANGGTWLMKPLTVVQALQSGSERLKIPVFYALDAALGLHATSGCLHAYRCCAGVHECDEPVPRATSTEVALEALVPPLCGVEGGVKRAYWSPQHLALRTDLCATSLADLVNLSNLGRARARESLHRITISSVQRVFLLALLLGCGRGSECDLLVEVNAHDLLVRPARGSAEADGEGFSLASSVGSRVGSSAESSLELLFGDAKKALTGVAGNRPFDWQPMLDKVHAAMSIDDGEERDEERGEGGGRSAAVLPWEERPFDEGLARTVLSWSKATFRLEHPWPSERCDEHPLQAELAPSWRFVAALQAQLRLGERPSLRHMVRTLWPGESDYGDRDAPHQRATIAI